MTQFHWEKILFNTWNHLTYQMLAYNFASDNLSYLWKINYKLKVSSTGFLSLNHLKYVVANNIIIVKLTISSLNLPKLDKETCD